MMAQLCLTWSPLPTVPPQSMRIPPTDAATAVDRAPEIAAPQDNAGAVAAKS
jgi:hypothetical protein